EGPGETGGRGLVAGDEQSDQLVAQLAVGHRVAVLVAREEQHRADVLAILEVGGVAAGRDLLVDQLVHRPSLAPRALPPPPPPPRSGRRSARTAAASIGSKSGRSWSVCGA